MPLVRMLAIFILLEAVGIFFFRCGAPLPEEDPMDDRFLTRRAVHHLRIGGDSSMRMEAKFTNLISRHVP